MSPRRYTAEQAKGVFEVDWPLFGELSRALALRVARAYDPEVVIGVATAGVVPGAVVAAILDREFHSLIVSRRYRSDDEREAPEVFGEVPRSEEHTSELQSRQYLVCRLLLETQT